VVTHPPNQGDLAPFRGVVAAAPPRDLDSAVPPGQSTEGRQRSAPLSSYCMDLLILLILVAIGAGCFVIGNRLIAKSRTPNVPTDLKRADDAERGVVDDGRSPGEAAFDAIDRWRPLP